MSTETELKLDVPPRLAARVLAHPVLRGRPRTRTSTVHLLAVYYDTPKFDLWQAQVCIRLRRERSGWVQTVKWAGDAVGGLHRRNEIEQAVEGQSLVLDGIELHPGLEALGDERLRSRLEPVFVTEFDRTLRVLTLADGSSIEASLDRGRILRGTVVRPISELELELKSGAPLALFDLAEALVADFPLRPAHRSKAERGYVMAGLQQRPSKARRVEFDPALDIGGAAMAIVASCLHQMQENADGMLAAGDIEYLHQLRVGVRRLRSGLGLLGRVLPGGVLDPLKMQLRWLGGRLGAARDWDVFRAQALPELARGLKEFVGQETLDALDRSAQVRGERSGRSARTAWASRRTSGLLLSLGRAAAGGGFVAAHESLRQPLAPYCAAVLERRLARVQRLGRKARARASIERLHELRIAVKKLRYAVEFFGALYPGDQVQRFRGRVVKLQDSLGRICDSTAIVTRVVEAMPGAATLADCVRGWAACLVDGERMQLRKAWRDFKRSPRFW